MVPVAEWKILLARCFRREGIEARCEYGTAKMSVGMASRASNGRALRKGVPRLKLLGRFGLSSDLPT